MNKRLIDPARFIYETVECAMRTDRLNGAHGAPYDLMFLINR